MPDSVNMELLEKEYFHLQSVVEDFDSKSLTIKAWSVTLGIGVAGSGAFTENFILLSFASIAAFMFWLIDAYWKTFQYAYYLRIIHIENYLSGNAGEIMAPQICTSWSESYHQGGQTRLYKILFWPHVVLPHGIMCIGFLILYFSLAKLN